MKILKAPIDYRVPIKNNYEKFDSHDQAIINIQFEVLTLFHINLVIISIIREYMFSAFCPVKINLNIH